MSKYNFPEIKAGKSDDDIMLITCPDCNHHFPYKADKEYTRNTILTEGADDEKLILALIRYRRVRISDLTVEPKDGYSSVLSRLINIKRNSGFNNIDRLLVVVDANSVGAQVRFQEIISKLDRNEFSLPIQIGILSRAIPGKKQCGIFLFPDNINGGTVEDMCLKALSHPEKLHCIDEHINCIKSKNLLTTNTHDISKSKFHIYMSTSPKPTGSIGGATQSSELDLSSRNFDILVTFLQQLQ